MTQRKDQLYGSWGSSDSECIIMLSCGKCQGISAAIKPVIKAWNVTAIMTGEHKAEYCTNYECTILITIINQRVSGPSPKSQSLIWIWSPQLERWGSSSFFSSSMLLFVHRDRTDYWRWGALRVHFHFYTAPVLWDVDLLTSSFTGTTSKLFRLRSSSFPSSLSFKLSFGMLNISRNAQ